MSDNKKQKNNRFSTIITLIAFAAIIYLITQNLNTFLNILIVLIGFSAVILIHEFGHFIVAKMSGIKVEAFSIGFPPLLIGISTTKKGLKIRFLPSIFGSSEQQKPDKDQNISGDTAKSMTTENDEEEGTEYRIGLVPFGGYVKMLGQEDGGVAEKTDDPRSFANKPVSIRIAVVAAGVIFNIISAVIIYLVVFSVGIDLPPAVVGSVTPNSPADVAGIKPGDRIVEVNGETFVDFTTLALAPALTGKDKAIEFVVQHADGNREEIDIKPEFSENQPMFRTLGIGQANTLKIEDRLKNPREIELFKETGFEPGDLITHVNGKPVKAAYQLDAAIQNALSDSVELTVERKGKTETVNVNLYWMHTNSNFNTEFDLGNIYSIVPRMQVLGLPPKSKPASVKDRLLHKLGLKKEQPADEIENGMQVGDIIVKVADIENPTYKELRETTDKNEGKKMDIVVLRKDEKGELKEVTVPVYPSKSPGSDRVTFGIIPRLETDSTVVAKTIETGNGKKLDIPSGAEITSVAGQAVKNYYDIVQVMRENAGKTVDIAYKLGDASSSVPVDLTDNDKFLHVSSVPLPPEDFKIAAIPVLAMKETYKASGAVEALKMGFKKTYQFIYQTVVTLKGLIFRDVSPKTLMGPVGIVSASYSIAQKGIIHYIYFMGLISACIAVMNLLPLPIVDGGVIVLLIIEKIKGSPLNERFQEVISYAGLAFLLFVFVWLTYNDIIRMLFG